MYDLAQNGYDNAEILSLLRSSRTVSYRYELLNRDDVPIGEISATGSIMFDAAARIKRAASLNVKELKDIDFLNDRVKIYMILNTGRERLSFPMGVFLMSSPSRSKQDGAIYRSIDCYDKLQILSDDKFINRYLIPAGTGYVAAAAEIIMSAGIEDFYIQSSGAATGKDIEFEIGTTKLDAVNSLLKAINYNDLYVDSYGQFRAGPYIAPELRMVECEYATDKKSVVLPGAIESLDAFAAPNRIVRYLQDADRLEMLIATVDNNDPMSPLSIPSRGRVIVDAEAVNDIADLSTLEAYTQRLLAESKLYQQIEFETAVMPHHGYLDCLYLNNTELDIQGKYIEQSWKIDLSVGGKMRHVARKAVDA